MGRKAADRHDPKEAKRISARVSTPTVGGLPDGLVVYEQKNNDRLTDSEELSAQVDRKIDTLQEAGKNKLVAPKLMLMRTSTTQIIPLRQPLPLHPRHATPLR